MNGIECQWQQSEPVGPAEIGTRTWTLAIRNSDNTINVIYMKPTISVLNPDAVSRIRACLCDHASEKWRLRLLLYLSVIEVGVATVEAVLGKPQQIEMIIHHYSMSPFLTAAFNRPSILSSLPSSDSRQGEHYTIRLLLSTSPTIGSKVIVFRAPYEKLQKVLEIWAVFMIGLFLGCLAGLASGKVDIGIAAIAAWLQFAQLVQTSRWLRT